MLDYKEAKTAYFLDETLNIYTTPVANRREAIKIAEQHGQEFIGFITPNEAANIVEERTGKDSTHR